MRTLPRIPQMPDRRGRPRKDAPPRVKPDLPLPIQLALNVIDKADVAHVRRCPTWFYPDSKIGHINRQAALSLVNRGLCEIETDRVKHKQIIRRVSA